MNNKALCAESENLRAIALMNGRAKSDVSVYWIESNICIHSDELNPVSAKQRDAFIERMPESPAFLREETEYLLSDLAEQAVEERANASAAKIETPDNPFPEPEPWRAAVDGESLLDELVELLGRYVVLPRYGAEAVALWLVHTYVIDIADYTPYLHVSSPVRECGKSTLLEMLEKVAHRGKKTDSITAGALYRIIDKQHPTMLLDELDARLKMDGSEGLRGVLNSGFKRCGRVTLCAGDDHEVCDYSTWSPKVLAGIGRLWDTVTSRSIPVRLARATKGELTRLTKMEGHLIDDVCLPYRQRLLRWANDNRETLRVADPVAPDELGARQCDVWRPLFAIADASGGRWPDLGRAAACALHGVAEDEGDYGLLLLQDLKALFANSGDAALTSSGIIEVLITMEDRPWSEYRNDRPITKRGLASLVGRFGVKPKNIRVGSDVVKGYEYSALLPAFTTYLTPPRLSATSATVAPDGRGEAWEPDETQLTAFEDFAP